MLNLAQIPTLALRLNSFFVCKSVVNTQIEIHTDHVHTRIISTIFWLLTGGCGNTRSSFNKWNWFINVDSEDQKKTLKAEWDIHHFKIHYNDEDGLCDVLQQKKPELLIHKWGKEKRPRFRQYFWKNNQLSTTYVLISSASNFRCRAVIQVVWSLLVLTFADSNVSEICHIYVINGALVVQARHCSNTGNIQSNKQRAPL